MGLPWWMVVVGVLLGGAVLACLVALGEPIRDRWRTRRRSPPPVLHSDWVLGDPRLAAQVSTALCHLRRGLAAVRLPPPDVEVVLAGHDRLVLRMARPAPVPPFLPWRTEAGDEDGRSWVVDAADLPQWVPGPVPYPLLVAVGRYGGWTVLVDLAQAPRSLAGDEGRARQLLAGLAYGLATNPWSREVRVVVGGVGGVVAVPQPGRVVQFRTATEAVGYALGQPGPAPLAVLLGQPPPAGPVGGPRTAVVVAEPFPAGGRRSLDPLGFHPLAGRRVGACEVAMLGPFQVRAPGSRSPGAAQAAVLATLVAVAALRPGGVPTAVVAELLPQPRAVPPAIRQLHDWLGADGTGLPRLCERDGAWRLSQDTRVDVDTFRELVTADDAQRERDRLGSALTLVRGELLAGIPLGPVAQRVLAGPIAEIQALAVRAARRDAELAVGAGQLVRAEWALRQGLALLPRVEELWRALLEFQLTHHREAVDQTVHELVTRLAAGQGSSGLEPATQKLLTRLRKAGHAVPVPRRPTRTASRSK